MVGVAHSRNQVSASSARVMEADFTGAEGRIAIRTSVAHISSLEAALEMRSTETT